MSDGGGPSPPRGASGSLPGTASRVRGSDPDGWWPDDFGDPAAGHATLIGTAGVVSGPARLLLRVEGERAAPMIGGLVTNDVATLPVDHAVYAFLLTPKGRPIADLRVIRLHDALWLDLPAAAGQDVLAHLAKYVPPRLARVTALPGVERLSVIGPRSAEVVAALSSTPAILSTRATTAARPLPEMEPLQVAVLPVGGAEARVVRREEAEGPGYDLYLPAGAAEARDALLEAARRAGGGAVGLEAFEIWRVERGIPVWGAEISPEVLPQETGLETRAISLTKGCYAGQEVVARIHYRGHVNRHLRGLRFPAPRGRPALGQRLYDGEREVGALTSSALSPRHGPIGLGYVRREVEPGATVATTPGARPDVAVEALPFTYE